jgi:hypothetical protein
MADFGQEGTRSVTVGFGGTKLRRSGGEADYLHYKLTAKGPNPNFSLTSDSNKEIWSHDQFPTPQMNYELKWPKSDADIEGPDVFYVLLLHFIGAVNAPVEYRLVLDHCDKNGDQVKRVKDITYKSTAPTDSYSEPINVGIK